MPDAAPLPRVTPFLVDRAETMCARRLRRHFQGLGGDQGAFTRGRIRDPLVADARDAHREMGPPNAASFSVRPELVPEERAVQQRAIDHYLTLFEGEPLRAVDHDPFDHPVESADGEFLVGGWIDVVGKRPDGVVELRQFELWGRRRSPEPIANPALLLAALRIHKALRPDELVIRLTDLVAGRADEARVDFRGGVGELGSQFSRRLARIRARVARGEPDPGRDCGSCPYVNGCPAFR